MQLNMLSVSVLLLCLLTIANSEVLPDQHNENIDPIKQTGDESEASDQSKRTIFDSGNVYGIEKHVRLHPSGYKYLLGYRPVKFQLVPVARPLYGKPALWKSPNLQFSAKPVVTLLPPKTVPVFKQNNQWKFGKLPVNVPPSVPLKPWQLEGWTPLNKDNTPFVPSVPLPEPASAIVPSQSPIIPIIPTSVVPTVSVFPPTAFVPQKPVPAPIPTLNSIVPIQPPPVLPAPALPTQPTVHVSPVHIVNVGGRPLVPINYLPGKFNLPVSNLGVLPLGSTVPVQSQHGFVHKLPPQIILSRLPFPGSIFHQEHAPVIPPAHALAQPVLPQPHPVLPQSILPQHHPVLPHPILPQPVAHPFLHQHVQPLQPAFPQPSQPLQPAFPQHVHPFQPALPQPEIPEPVFPHHIPQPIPVPQPPPSHPHIHIISHQSPDGPSQPLQPAFPQPAQPLQPAFPQHVHPFQPGLPQPEIPEPVFPHQIPQPVPVPQPPPSHPHIHIISHQSPEGPGQQNIQLPAHNFQFFAQNGQTQFNQEVVPQFQPQPQPQPQQPDQGYHYDPPLQQEVQESPGFFQPGKTDLQIPGYLPEHPHLRQTFIPSQQDPNTDS